LEKRIPISPGERDALRSYLAAVDSAKRDVGVAAGMILAREGISESGATLERVEDSEIVCSVPDLQLVPDAAAEPARAT
jgi:hypothetical protein